MKNDHELEYYSAPGPMTDLTGCAPELLDRLPEDPAGLMKVVRRLVVTADVLKQVYDGPVPSWRDGEAGIRHAAAMVERIVELDPSPLAVSRSPERRFIGNCRHFATLTCALMRHAGTPARVRAGFAGYFFPNTWADHWIIEYWHEEGWVRVDPQYGDAWMKATVDAKATSEVVAQSMYWSGGEAWQRCRRGELDPNRCNMGGVNWGIGEVRGSVLFDLAALNQDEMLPWDCWGRMEAAYKGETDGAYDDLLDAVSEVVVRGDLEAIRELYGREDDLRVPASLLNGDAA
jgi:hypothetical protein